MVSYESNDTISNGVSSVGGEIKIYSHAGPVEFEYVTMIEETRKKSLPHF